MCMSRCASWLRCNDFREVHSVPGRWLFLHSRWTWRIRLDSMPSHAKPAPVASKATAIASIPTVTCRWAKLARQTTIATTPTAKRRRPGVFAPLFIDSPARARVVRWWSMRSREVSPMRTDYPDLEAKKRLSNGVQPLTVKPANKARMDCATAYLVATGSSELAINIAPRFSAPNSSRVTVSGSSTRSAPA